MTTPHVLEYDDDNATSVEFVHVYPLFGRQHEFETQCWCHPEFDISNPAVLVHNVEH